MKRGEGEAEHEVKVHGDESTGNCFTTRGEREDDSFRHVHDDLLPQRGEHKREAEEPDERDEEQEAEAARKKETSRPRRHKDTPSGWRAAPPHRVVQRVTQRTDSIESMAEQRHEQSIVVPP